MVEVLNEFASDTHRRVGGVFLQPRSLADAARFLHINDPYVEDRAYNTQGLEEIVKDLQAEGLVKKVGKGTAREILKKIASDDALPTVPKEKAKLWTDRATLRGDRYPHPEDEDQWATTQAYLDRVNGPIPNEPPPLVGEELARVEAHNREIAEADERLREEAQG